MLLTKPLVLSLERIVTLASNIFICVGIKMLVVAGRH